MACDAQTLLAAAAARGYQKLSLRQIRECTAYLAGVYGGAGGYVTPAGLKAYYRAEDNIIDQTGNTQAVNTNVTFGPGVLGDGFSMVDGSGYLQFLDSTVFQVQGFTFSCWRQRAIPNDVNLTNGVGLYSGHPSGAWGLFEYGTNFNPALDGYIALTQVGLVAFPESSIAFPDDLLWHHAAVTMDAVTGDVCYYMDGQPAGTTSCAAAGLPPSPFDFPGGSFEIFGHDNGADAFWGGLDETAFWQRVLAPAEILSIYNRILSGSPIA